MKQVEKIYMTPRERKERIRTRMKDLGLNPEEFPESFAAYLPRAVSTVPADKKVFLEGQYKAICRIFDESGIEKLLPFELVTGVNPNEVNPRNHRSIYMARLIVPLTYAVSDGRGWEEGFTYGRKGLFPLVLREQITPPNKPNIPTLRLPFQVPIIFDNMTQGKDGQNFLDLLLELKEYDFGTGKCSRHGDSLLGFNSSGVHCMRCVASTFMEVLPADIPL